MFALFDYSPHAMINMTVYHNFGGNHDGQEKTDISIRSSAAEYLTFVAATGESDESVEMRYEDENIWLTQKMMAVLYDADVRTINYHIKKVFHDKELTEASVIRKFRIAADV